MNEKQEFCETLKSIIKNHHTIEEAVAIKEAFDKEDRVNDTHKIMILLATARLLEAGHLRERADLHFKSALDIREMLLDLVNWK